jgi:hypothetical protein
LLWITVEDVDRVDEVASQLASPFFLQTHYTHRFVTLQAKGFLLRVDCKHAAKREHAQNEAEMQAKGNSKSNTCE